MMESLLLASFSTLLLLLMVVISFVKVPSPVVEGAVKKLPKSSSSSLLTSFPLLILLSFAVEGPSSRLSPNKSIVFTAEDEDVAAVVEAVVVAESEAAAAVEDSATLAEGAAEALTCAIRSGLLGEMASFCLMLAEAATAPGGGKTTAEAGVEGFELLRPNITSSRPEEKDKWVRGSWVLIMLDDKLTIYIGGK